MNLHISLEADLEQTIHESAEVAGLSNAVALLAHVTVAHASYVIRDLSVVDQKRALSTLREGLDHLEVGNLDGAVLLENFTLEIRVLSEVLT